MSTCIYKKKNSYLKLCSKLTVYSFMDSAWDRFTDKLVSILTQTYVEVKVEPVTSTSSEHETSTLPVVPDLLRATAADVKQESPSPAKQMKKTALTFLLDDDGNLCT